MPPTSTSYYLGRLNVIPSIGGDKEPYLLAGMQDPPTVTFRRTKWSFFEVRAETIEDNRFIHGFLVKYRPDGSEEVVSEEAHLLTMERVHNQVEAKSRFFLHLPSMIIAFHPVLGHIDIKTFIQRFVDLLKEGHGGFFILPEIQLIQEEDAVFEAIRRFESISKITIYLHPSNPDFTEEWDEFDRHLKTVGAASYREEYIAPPGEGLNIAQDRDIHSKIAMAKDGYGKAAVKGTIDGRVRTITTQKSPVTAQAPRDPEVEAGRVVGSLRTAINSVLHRFGKSL